MLVESSVRLAAALVEQRETVALALGRLPLETTMTLDSDRFQVRVSVSAFRAFLQDEHGRVQRALRELGVEPQELEE